MSLTQGVTGQRLIQKTLTFPVPINNGGTSTSSTNNGTSGFAVNSFAIANVGTLTAGTLTVTGNMIASTGTIGNLSFFTDTNDNSIMQNSLGNLIIKNVGPVDSIEIDPSGDVTIVGNLTFMNDITGINGNFSG